MCELYDDLEKLKKEEIEKRTKQQLEGALDMPVVIMEHCTDHCFHKDCLEMQHGKSDFVKCAVCSRVYGEYHGDMPTGTMSWEFHAKGQMPCAGFESQGTWSILYQFPNGKRNGVAYRGTTRQAFIPDTEEGREVMILLMKAFKRKLTFTVGTSVTTGQQNVVVWTSIHHKTNLHGGATHYGYPDGTYLNRVKLELADKGVVLEDPKEADYLKTNKKGKIKVN